MHHVIRAWLALLLLFVAFAFSASWAQVDKRVLRALTNRYANAAEYVPAASRAQGCLPREILSFKEPWR